MSLEERILTALVEGENYNSKRSSRNRNQSLNGINNKNQR